MALTTDKVAGIRGDLVRNDDDWQNWDFVKLCDALGSWIRRNPVESSEDHRGETPHSKRDQIARRSYATQQTRACVYCEDPTHRGLECHRVTSFDERKNILGQRSSVSTAPDQNIEQSSVTAKFLAVIVPRNITHQSVIVNKHVSRG